MAEIAADDGRVFVVEDAVDEKGAPTGEQDLVVYKPGDPNGKMCTGDEKHEVMRWSNVGSKDQAEVDAITDVLPVEVVDAVKGDVVVVDPPIDVGPVGEVIP